MHINIEPKTQLHTDNNLYSQIVRLIERGDIPGAMLMLKSIQWELLSNDHSLLNAYGVVLRASGNYDEAIKAYHLALNLNPNHAGTWSNMGNALKDANFLESSIQAHIKALNLSKNPSSNLWHNYGIALSIAGKHNEAIVAFNKALNMPNSNPAIYWDMARSQLALKKYSDGFNNYQYRWFMNEAPPKRVVGEEWQGQELYEDELFVYVEQGFGDYMQCARFLPRLNDFVKNLTVEVKQELIILMRHSFPSINFVEYTENPIVRKNGFIFSVLELPRFFLDGAPDQTTKYLIPKATEFKFSEDLCAKLLDQSRFNIGIIWSGSVTFKRNASRSADISWFLKSLNLPNIRLFSLQLGPRSTDLQLDHDKVVSTELLPYMSNFNDTAQILQKLDMVIMTCSSVAHLCGALNIPCWVLLDYSPHWLWGTDVDSSDWYSSLKLFRQKTPGDWKPVFDDVSALLINKNKAAHGQLFSA